MNKRIKNAIHELEEKGAVVKCLERDDQVLSPYFLRKKPNGTDRFILNLKWLNQFIKKRHFKMEDFRTATQLTNKNDYLASIDIKDAYFLVALHKDSRKYVRFTFEDETYEFVCLAFGLSSAPYIFTKLMKAPTKILRTAGYTNVIYLDDYLAIENTPEKCSKNINAALNLFTSLGLIINHEKSELMPVQRCTFLGVEIDTARYCIQLPRRKMKHIHALIETYLNMKSCSIRSYAVLIGTLISCCPAVEYAWLYTKILEKEKIFELIWNNYRYDAIMHISTEAKEELEWWKSNIKIRIDTSPASSSSPPDCRQSVRQALIARGAPEEATEIMIASLSNATLRQYSGALKQWNNYCLNKNININDINKYNLLGFLTEKYKEGASHGTLNSHRSALSLLSNNKIGDHPDITRFMKGVHKLRPARPKYAFTWDAGTVIEHLKTLDCTSLKLITYKTVMLIALSTAQRAQTISLLKLNNIKEVSKGLIIMISDLVKTSGPGKEQPLLHLPTFPEQPNICVATTIEEYIKLTSQFRGDNQHLFISLNPPYKSVGAEAISRWLKKCLELCGINTQTFSGHSTRHAASSKADEKGIDIDTIRRTVGWSKGSQTFAVL
uniref:Reverse transcriptase domain-containing protein n=1 Tax=Trichogramma kaykai TaxID=54128 RepID=A0ABD2WZD2_9HYME